MIKRDEIIIRRWLGFIREEYGERYSETAYDVVYNWRVKDFNALPLSEKDRIRNRSEDSALVGEVFLPEWVIEVARIKLDYNPNAIPFREQMIGSA